MIKFWKSAAKGKSGCPVRPPEQNSTISADIRPLLTTQTIHENEDQLDMFEKKSKLSLTLHDILIDKKGIKYFIQFMESIGQHLLVKCWLDMENFKRWNLRLNHDFNNHSEINRTKSIDLHCKCKSDKENNKEIKLQRFSWTQNSDILSTTGNSNTIKGCSTSSCGNIVEHALSENCNVFENPQKMRTEEAINIFKKYVALEAPYRLDLPDSLRKSVISNICHTDGQIKEDCFKPVQEKLFCQIQDNYFNDFLNHLLYIKAQIDILTNGSLYLNDIIHNETILFYFTEYLEQESCRVLLEFLMAVMHFRDNLISGNTTNSEQSQADAIVLYDKYFSLQATHPVGFPTDIRLEIESEICREGGPLYTCFDIPYQIVYKTLNQYVKTFLESEVYFKYLSEMIHTVDQSCSSHHRSHSDCSSEYSISTQNTLLAMGDPVFRKKKRNHSVPDMTIDSNQLYNADSLWQRNRHDGLSLGRVTSLGRFESKLEPDPDKKESVIKKMVSRFVPSNTSKVEEEMAWQIAHMIVKDVTDLTMAPPDDEHIDE